MDILGFVDDIKNSVSDFLNDTGISGVMNPEYIIGGFIAILVVLILIIPFLQTLGILGLFILIKNFILIIKYPFDGLFASNPNNTKRKRKKHGISI